MSFQRPQGNTTRPLKFKAAGFAMWLGVGTGVGGSLMRHKEVGVLLFASEGGAAAQTLSISISSF